MDTIGKIPDADKLQQLRELLKKARDFDEFRLALGKIEATNPKSDS